MRQFRYAAGVVKESRWFKSDEMNDCQGWNCTRTCLKARGNDERVDQVGQVIGDKLAGSGREAEGGRSRYQQSVSGCRTPLEGLGLLPHGWFGKLRQLGS